MRKNHRKVLAFILALSLAISLFAVPASAEGQGTDGKAVRTIMLYDCGSNLETMGGMATYNLMQILRANFSADADVRFIVMTGGSEGWQTKSEYLYDPATGTSPEKIDPTYNQIWEARGLDAANPAERGKLVLVDGDGVMGDGENAKRAQILDDDYYEEDGFIWFREEHTDNYEWMSDPEVLKAFINFCAENYPAENYDLILWDHGGGPMGGFGNDENDPNGGLTSMSFPELTDALYDNDVVNGGGKFDFIDFDACLMNSVELDLTLAGCTHYYIASPETEPGYGQDFEGWLNALGKDPYMDTMDLGRIIVDDFTAFYDKSEGDGSSQDGTLAIVDLEKLMASDFAAELTELNRILNESSGWFYFDEMRSFSASLRYGNMNYWDLGNLVSQLSFAYKEANYGNVDDGETFDTTNDYTDCAEKLLTILNDPAIIYARGTEEIHTEAQYYRDADGTMRFGTQGTSGTYLFFPASNDLTTAMSYYKIMGHILEMMPEGTARDFMDGYRLTMLKYAMVYYTGQAITEMISEEQNKDLVEIGKAYDTLKAFWQEGAENEEDLRLTKWGSTIKPILDILVEAEGQEAIDEWMEINAWGIARDAILRSNISVTSEKGKQAFIRTVDIANSVKQAIDSVNVNVLAEFPAYKEYVQENYPEDEDFFLGVMPGLQIGTIKGELVRNVDPENDGYWALVKWLLDENSTWNLPEIEEKWYAIRDGEGNLHAVDAELEDDGVYIRTGYPEQVASKTEDGETQTAINWHIVYLRFVDNKLQTLYFKQDAGGYRDISVSELVGELELTPLVDVDLFLFSLPFPISETSFRLSADTAKDISLVYTDVKNISDIGDITGDGKSLTTQVVIRNVYGYEMDISDLVAEADNNVKPAPRPGGGGGGVTTPSNPVSLPDPASAPSGGKVTASAASAKAGDKVTLTLTPDDGYQVTGVTVTDKNGKDVPVTKNDDGTYSFTMPAAAVTVTPAFEKISESAAAPGSTDKADVSKTFTDVNGNAWYHDAVQWAVDKGLMNGVGNNTFQPNGTATRAMVVTMLWRLAGEPEAGASGFTDVADAAWYAGAVAWAEETGAVKGISETEFAPNETVTREQLAAILYRFAQAQGKGFTGAWSFPLSFPDAAEVSEYAYEPMCWMTMNGVINGMDDGTLAPGDNATRAQIAAMFMRFCAELEK